MSDRYRRPQVVVTGDIRDLTHGSQQDESDGDGTYWSGQIGGGDGDGGDGDGGGGDSGDGGGDSGDGGGDGGDA
jgi:hypothetical protein